MSFLDKVEEREFVNMEKSKHLNWQGGIRFHFNETYSTIVGTTWADGADIFWDPSAEGVWNDPTVKVSSFTLHEGVQRARETEKRFFEEDDILDAFVWLAQNTS